MQSTKLFADRIDRRHIDLSRNETLFFVSFSNNLAQGIHYHAVSRILGTLVSAGTIAGD
jgi:hypothetical protein